MLKKYLAVLLMAAIIGLVSVVSATAEPLSLTEEEEAALLNEPPLTQAEIDLFIKIAPELMAAGEGPEADAVDKIGAQAGLSRIRTAYLGSKIGLGYSIITDPEGTKMLLESGFIPQGYLPTDQELELIKNNLDALNKMINDI